MMYYIVPVLFLLAFWCPCMTINVSMHYNGGLLPDIVLLTQCYPILYLMGYYIASVSAFCVLLSDIILLTQCCVLLSDIILLTHCYCHRGTRVKMPWRGLLIVVGGFVFAALVFPLTRIPCSGSVFTAYVIVYYYYHV